MSTTTPIKGDDGVTIKRQKVTMGDDGVTIKTRVIVTRFWQKCSIITQALFEKREKTPKGDDDDDKCPYSSLSVFIKKNTRTVWKSCIFSKKCDGKKVGTFIVIIVTIVTSWRIGFNFGGHRVMRKTTFKQSVHGDNEALSNTNEYAYRRGVHQALGMLQFFLEDNNADINVVLPMAVEKARNIRASSKDAPFLLHYLFEEIKTELERKAKKVTA